MAAGGDGRAGGDGVMGPGNGGRAPSANILRAIRHGVAAGACRVAARATGDGMWSREAERQSLLVGEALHQATSLSPARAVMARRRR